MSTAPEHAPNPSTPVTSPVAPRPENGELYQLLRRLPLNLYDANVFDQRDHAFMERVAPLVYALLSRYHRAEITGLERVPEGAALLVGNHSGGLLSIDSFLWGARYIMERGAQDAPFGLAHSVAVNLPIINQLLVPVGAVEAREDNARRLFDAGHKVLVYPGGDVESMRPYRERHRVKFSGRKGYVRLALRAGVPIVPVAAAGAQTTFLVLSDMRWLAEKLNLKRWFRTEVWPLMLTIPWGVTLGPSPPYIPLPTPISVDFLEPIRFDRAGEEAARDEAYVAACAARVEAALQDALDRLVAGRAFP